MATRTIAVLLLIATLIASPQVLPARPAYACSCFTPELDELVARAELVILGTVVQIDQVERAPKTLPRERDLTLHADEYLKGLGPDRFHVQDFSQGSLCSVFSPDSIGNQYLLFLSRWEGNLRAGSCTGSGRVKDIDFWAERIEEVRQIVREPAQPDDTPALTATPGAPQLPAAGSGSDSEPLVPLATAIAGAIGLLGAGLLLTVRRLRSS